MSGAMSDATTRPKIYTCLSPALVPYQRIEGAVVVVIDVLRATTSMCVALDHGAEHIVPVASVEECAALKAQGYLAAAERNGQTVEGFEFGNSPYSFMHDLRGKRLAMTTTNGTQAIAAAHAAEHLVIGAYVNISALAEWLLQLAAPRVILLCSGWKNNPNLEDSSFAGALAERLLGHYTAGDDATVLATSLYRTALVAPRRFLDRSSHFARLISLGLQRDAKYCLRADTHPVVPILRQGQLVDALREPLAR
jgi:2-phosphosulfolactate phosphatase